jgi:hypothetical protein
VVNTSILGAVREVQNFINRAYTDSGFQPGTTFKTEDVMEYLRYGRDKFNASDKPTQFTMLNATGPFKHFWVTYSSAAACRAQYLNEGMKAFNYSGQEVQLDVDRSTFWDQMASNLEQSADNQIKVFKDNLTRRGTFSGDGSYMGINPQGVGAIGITLHGASPFRGGFNMFPGLSVGGLSPLMWW